MRVDRSLEPLRSIESNYRSRPSLGDKLSSPMSQAFTPVPSRLASAPGAASEKGQPARRGRSPGRRSGDKHGLWDDQAVLLADQITAHEVAETILEKRDRMIAIVGHDLRGLLNALTVNAELLLRTEGPATVESARNVRRTIGRMEQLIARLLDSVRLNSDGLEIVPRPLDAAALVREAVEIFRPLARVKSLSLSLAIPDAPLRATADRDRMFQVLSNLLSNAIKFSSVEGKIAVHATGSGHDLQVSVQDEGPGIPERDLDRVFEPLFQLQESDARGLGLGLYISRAIIEAHGGKIWATSRPGAGSTFCFTVPRTRSERGLSGPPDKVAPAATV
jgi:signal transduction histidine kinase